NAHSRRVGGRHGLLWDEGTATENAMTKTECTCDKPATKLCDKCKKKAERAAQRKRLKEAMDSIGLTKVRGAQGGVYWE
ncbi:hypothetical protein, partial [Bacillus cereus]